MYPTLPMIPMETMDSILYDFFDDLKREFDEEENTFLPYRIYDSEEEQERYIMEDSDYDDNIPISYNPLIENLPEYGTRENPIYINTDDDEE